MHFQYRISGNFREDLIFAIFANDLKTRKYVSAKNCTLKESLEVGAGLIFCCIQCLIWNPEVNQGTIWCNYYTNSLYKPASFIRAQEPLGSSDLLWSCVVRRPSIVRRPSVRPSSVKLFTFSTSSPEPLDGFWWHLVWMKYSRSLTSVVVFRPDPSRGGSRAGQK